MSGFDATWLALREAADARSRAAFAWPAIVPRGRGPLRILDLATGTGANLRHLAPRIGGDQEWLLADLDPDLLDALAPAMARWAVACGYDLHRVAGTMGVTGPGFRCRWRVQRIDLARALERLPIAGHRLVTASALLDLVSAGWLGALIAESRRAGASVLFALTYDGRLECTPVQPDDAWVRGLLNRHQRTDKGFGPALGPAANPWAAAALARQGYRVACCASDWRLGPADVPLQEALLRGFAAAARAVEPAAAGRVEAWWEGRMASLGRGESHILVGHRDLAAVLPGAC